MSISAITAFVGLSVPSVVFAVETQRFGDWVLQCEDSGPVDERSCQITQVVSSADDGREIMAVVVGYRENAEVPSIAFGLPPQAVADDGMAVAVDANAPLTRPIDRCDEQRCLVVANLRADVLDQFKKGNFGLVTFTVPDDQRLGIRISLKGFTAAFNALEQQHKGG